MIREIPYKDREEWLGLRKWFLGGSEAGAVMGMDDYASPYSVWAEKTGRVPGFGGNITTRVGGFLEDLVASLFEEETGKKVRRKNRMLVNDQYPWACADVDRLVVGEKAVLECKTTNSFPAMRKIRGGEYPERWYCQMVHYLAVTGLERAYLAVLVGCREFRVFELERDQTEIDALMAAEAAFWELVEAGTPPAPDGLEATTETISTIYAESRPASIDLFGKDGVLRWYMELKAQKKELDTQLAEIENSLKEELGEAQSGVCGSFCVSWKPQSRRTFDAKRYAADHPEAELDGYWKESRFRKFEVKEQAG